jgi:hypothetical protein
MGTGQMSVVRYCKYANVLAVNMVSLLCFFCYLSKTVPRDRGNILAIDKD